MPRVNMESQPSEPESSIPTHLLSSLIGSFEVPILNTCEVISFIYWLVSFCIFFLWKSLCNCDSSLFAAKARVRTSHLLLRGHQSTAFWRRPVTWSKIFRNTWMWSLVLLGKQMGDTGPICSPLLEDQQSMLPQNRCRPQPWNFKFHLRIRFLRFEMLKYLVYWIIRAASWITG